MCYDVRVRCSCTDIIYNTDKLRLIIFFFKDTATTEIYTYWHTLSLHDALPIFGNVESSGIKVMVLAVIVGIGSSFFGEFITALQGREPTTSSGHAKPQTTCSSASASSQPHHDAVRASGGGGTPRGGGGPVGARTSVV